MSNRILALLVCPFLVFYLILSCLILPQETWSQNLRGINMVPDQEKRSCIQVVDGYAYLSENMTLAETWAAAFANAKRQVLEMAKTYIKSKTIVERK